MNFVDDIRTRAGRHRPRIAFAEVGDSRARDALEILGAGRGIRPVAVAGHREQVDSLVIPPGVELVQPHRDKHLDMVLAHLAAKLPGDARVANGTIHSTFSALEYAASLLALDLVDGVVAGAVATSAEVLRTGIRLVGMAPGVKSVSSLFYMILGRDSELERVVTFADCAVIPEPTAQQLAEIAIGAARERRTVVGDVPVVALLSYSTAGSAQGSSVEKVREALRIARESDPQLAIDGELQGDAALVREIRGRKAPASSLDGNANVLIFPSLDAGNISYKLVQHFAEAEAIGPILTGLRRPYNDLSRGATRDDILNVAAVTAIQAEIVTTREGP